jgi:hypothetical protein
MWDMLGFVCKQCLSLHPTDLWNVGCIFAKPIVDIIETPYPTAERPYEAEYSCGNYGPCLTKAARGDYGPERATQEAEAQD